MTQIADAEERVTLLLCARIMQSQARYLKRVKQKLQKRKIIQSKRRDAWIELIRRWVRVGNYTTLGRVQLDETGA